jgi:hypothetical protein
MRSAKKPPDDRGKLPKSTKQPPEESAEKGNYFK